MTIVSQPFSENTYVLSISGRADCLVVDPGMEPGKIVEAMSREGLTPAAILLTHGHSDHIAGNRELKSRWPECPIVVGSGDASKLTDPRGNLSALFGLEFVSPKADILLGEGQQYTAAGFSLEILETPGHSSGHIVYLWKGNEPWIVIGGDVLFHGSIGRTDFPDGDFEQLAASIHNKLFPLPNDTVVLPGHGPETTIGSEKATNPFVGEPAGYREL